MEVGDGDHPQQCAVRLAAGFGSCGGSLERNEQREGEMHGALKIASGPPFALPLAADASVEGAPTTPGRPPSGSEGRSMADTHRFMVDRHEGDLSVVEVDGRAMLDLPRWLLPPAARADDVLAVTVEASGDRAVITIERDVAATARAQDAARAAVERLKKKDRGGDRHC
ncbi:MAG: hypothetical protein DMD41_05555 [Gemmatimonadetes bacterium]|nr:MAG: hypothetical protein DMD41_05555 [Gemmatimonadota bacterium]